MMPKTNDDRRAAQFLALFLVVCVVALLTVDKLPIPERLKVQIKRVLWTALLGAAAVLLTAVAALGMPWMIAGGLAVAAFAAAGGVWALSGVARAATGGGGGGGGDQFEPCTPGTIDPVTGGICLGLEYETD